MNEASSTSALPKHHESRGALLRVLARLLLSILWIPALAGAQEVARHAPPNGSTFPIAAAVEVPPGRTLVYLSGMVVPVSDHKATPGTEVTAVR